MNALDGAGLAFQPGGVLVGDIGVKTVHLGPRPETADHGETLEARHHPGRGHAGLRQHQGDLVAGFGAQLTGQRVTQHDTELTGLQILEVTVPHHLIDDGHVLLRFRLDAVDQHPGHVALVGEHALELDERRRRFHARVVTHLVGQRLPVGDRLAAVHGQMGDHPQNAGLKFPVEAVHHRQNGDQNGDTEHQPERGDQGDHGDETIAGPGAGVAQTHEQGKGSKHGAHLSTKTAACASRFVTTIRDHTTAI